MDFKELYIRQTLLMRNYPWEFFGCVNVYVCVCKKKNKKKWHKLIFFTEEKTLSHNSFQLADKSSLIKFEKPSRGCTASV